MRQSERFINHLGSIHPSMVLHSGQWANALLECFPAYLLKTQPQAHFSRTPTNSVSYQIPSNQYLLYLNLYLLTAMKNNDCYWLNPRLRRGERKFQGGFYRLRRLHMIDLVAKGAHLLRRNSSSSMGLLVPNYVRNCCGLGFQLCYLFNFFNCNTSHHCENWIKSLC